MTRLHRVLHVLAPLFVAACGGGDGSAPVPAPSPAPVPAPSPAPSPPPAPAPAPAPATFSLSGIVEGRISGDLMVANGSDRVTVPFGTTTFPIASNLPAGAAFDVSVVTSPAGHACEAAAPASGRVQTDTTVTIRCTLPPAYRIGGSVSGFAPAAATSIERWTILNAASADPRNRRAPGFVQAFGFTGLRHGDAYDLRVEGHPECTAPNSRGTIQAADGPTVVFQCVAPSSVTFTVTGLPADATGLAVALADEPAVLPVPGGTTQLAWPAPLGRYPLDLFVFRQPSGGVTCDIVAASVTLTSVGAATVPIACRPGSYRASGDVIGLFDAKGLQLSNGVQAFDVAAGTYGFLFTQAPANAAAQVLVTRQPDGLVCSTSAQPWGGTSGTAIVCDRAPSALGGPVLGLARPGLAVAVAGSALAIPAGSTRWRVPAVARGTNWQLDILTQPTGQLCALSGRQGLMPAAAVDDIPIACADEGTVSTLAVTPDVPIRGIATGPDGAAYFTMQQTQEVWRLPPGGPATRIARPGAADGVGELAPTTNLRGIAVDAGGAVFVADTGNRRLLRMDPSTGLWRTLWQGTRSLGDVALDGATGTLYVAASADVLLDHAGSNDRAIERVATDGTDLGPLILGTNRQGLPPSIALQGSRFLYIGVTTAGIARLALAEVPARGTVRIDDAPLFAPYTTPAGSALVAVAHLEVGAQPSVSALGADAAGNVYIGTINPSQIFKLAAPAGPGTPLSLHAGTGVQGTLDGPAGQSQWTLPSALAVDRNGDLLVGSQLLIDRTGTGLLRRVALPR